jgi:hypothetical protein
MMSNMPGMTFVGIPGVQFLPNPITSRLINIFVGKQHEKSRHGFLICFAIDDRASFNHLTSRILRLETIKEQKAQEIPMVICAMKSDLDADRVIAPDEGSVGAVLSYPEPHRTD